MHNEFLMKATESYIILAKCHFFIKFTSQNINMKHIITAAALSILSLHVDAQHITPFGLPDNFTEVKSTLPIEPEIQEMNRSTVGLSCANNTFWATNTSGQIMEFQLNGNTISFVGIVVASMPPTSNLALGVANNLTGGAYSPTFYSSGSGSLCYIYDGSAWQQMPGSTQCPAYNAAGKDNALYYQYNGSLPVCIEQHNGTVATTVYSNANQRFTVADLAVDDSGNIWILNGVISTQTDEIVVLSPTGAVINQFAFSLNTNNAYGCMLLNGTLYIGLGASNPVHPNTLLPVTFTSNTATAGTPISVPYTGLGDLASCSPGLPLAVQDLHPETIEFLLLQNAVNDVLKVQTRERNTDLSIYSLTGSLVYHNEFRNTPNDLISIDVSELQDGMYFIQSGLTKAKFVKVK